MLVKQAFDGEVIADLMTDDLESVERKLDAAVACFADRPNWLPTFRRIEMLRLLQRLVADEAEAFAMLIAREGGKPLTDARVEVARAIHGIGYAASELQHMGGTEIPMGLTEATRGRLAFTTREPIGVVVAISAFNHPLNLIVHQVVPAIATGCPVLIKPASTTPLTCLRFVELVHQAGFPEPYCQAVVPAEARLAERMAVDKRVAFLSFIGSGAIGWYLRSKLAPGTRCALEHGGCAPVIVDQSARLDRVIEPLVKGSYYHAGQVCVSVQRLFVHAAVKEEFLALFTARAARLKVGDPTLAETEVGPLILPQEVHRVESWVHEAVLGGGDLVLGGARSSPHVYLPTCLVEPPPEARVSTEEIFGPVTCVYEYSDLSDAIVRANNLPVAFQASIFSMDVDIALRAAKLLDASTVMINDHTAFRTDWMPFAGRRESGYGIGGIPHTMQDMTQSKMIVMNSEDHR